MITSPLIRQLFGAEPDQLHRQTFRETIRVCGAIRRYRILVLFMLVVSFGFLVVQFGLTFVDVAYMASPILAYTAMISSLLGCCVCGYLLGFVSQTVMCGWLRAKFHQPIFARTAIVMSNAIGHVAMLSLAITFFKFAKPFVESDAPAAALVGMLMAVHVVLTAWVIAAFISAVGDARDILRICFKRRGETEDEDGESQRRTAGVSILRRIIVLAALGGAYTTCHHLDCSAAHTAVALMFTLVVCDSLTLQPEVNLVMDSVTHRAAQIRKLYSGPKRTHASKHTYNKDGGVASGVAEETTRKSRMGAMSGDGPKRVCSKKGQTRTEPKKRVDKLVKRTSAKQTLRSKGTSPSRSHRNSQNRLDA